MTGLLDEAALHELFEQGDRAFKDGDYEEAFRALFTMPEPFADDGDISAWARDSVYFMAANGVLNGVGDNRFAPKLVVSGEETLNHATREQAILIAVRLVKNLSA